MLKEPQKLMLFLIRALLLITIFRYLDLLFVLVPYKNKELMGYFNEQMAVINQHCDKSQYRNPNFFTTVRFGYLKDEIAYCHRKSNGFVLVFDELYWRVFMSESDKKQVMMHELAHCVFQEKHHLDKTHFMAAYFLRMSEDDFNKQVDEYLKNKCGK